MLSTFPNYAVYIYWHDDSELIAILSGRMLYNGNVRIIVLNEGEGIIVNSKQFHFGLRSLSSAFAHLSPAISNPEIQRKKAVSATVSAA